jgi:quercetin dioxygenase-like cupin family protein
MEVIRVRKYKVTLDDVAPADLKLADGWKKMDIRFLISRETVGSDRVCFWRTVFREQSAHEKHLHRNSAEVMYCVAGRGWGGVGDQEHEMLPGTAVYIPKGTVHWARPAAYFEIVGLYTDVGSLEESGYEFVEHIG